MKSRGDISKILTINRSMSIFVVRKYLFCVLIIGFSIVNGNAQIYPKHSLILEAAGIGSYGSLNYERNIFEKKSIRFNASIGLSTLGLVDFNDKFNPDVIIPMKGMLLWNWRKHHLVIGIGQTFSSIPRVERPALKTKRRNTISGSPLLGYRWQNQDKRFFIQLTYSPIWEQYQRWQHWGGLGFGFSLKKRNINVD